MGRLEAAAVHRHGDRRDRQRRQDHHAADDPHGAADAGLRGTASPRNYNNHIGVPLSMLQMEPEHDYAVLELGASRAGARSPRWPSCAGRRSA